MENTTQQPIKSEIQKEYESLSEIAFNDPRDREIIQQWFLLGDVSTQDAIKKLEAIHDTEFLEYCNLI